MFEVQFFVFGLLSFAKFAKISTAKISTPKVRLMPDSFPNPIVNRYVSYVCAVITPTVSFVSFISTVTVLAVFGSISPLIVFFLRFPFYLTEKKNSFRLFLFYVTNLSYCQTIRQH